MLPDYHILDQWKNSRISAKSNHTACIRINKKLTKIGYYYTECHKFSSCNESNALKPESPLLLPFDEYAILAKGNEDEKLLFGSNDMPF